jgi:hypothetical protein
MSQCFVLDTPRRGMEKKQYWEMAKKKGSTQDRVDHLRYRKRAISGIAGEMGIFQQLPRLSSRRASVCLYWELRR